MSAEHLSYREALPTLIEDPTLRRICQVADDLGFRMMENERLNQRVLDLKRRKRSARIIQENEAIIQQNLDLIEAVVVKDPTVESLAALALIALEGPTLTNHPAIAFDHCSYIISSEEPYFKTFTQTEATKGMFKRLVDRVEEQPDSSLNSSGNGIPDFVKQFAEAPVGETINRGFTPEGVTVREPSIGTRSYHEELHYKYALFSAGSHQMPPRKRDLSLFELLEIIKQEPDIDKRPSSWNRPRVVSRKRGKEDTTRSLAEIAAVDRVTDQEANLITSYLASLFQTLDTRYPFRNVVSNAFINSVNRQLDIPEAEPHLNFLRVIDQWRHWVARFFTYDSQPLPPGLKSFLQNLAPYEQARLSSMVFNTAFVSLHASFKEHSFDIEAIIDNNPFVGFFKQTIVDSVVGGKQQLEGCFYSHLLSLVAYQIEVRCQEAGISDYSDFTVGYELTPTYDQYCTFSIQQKLINNIGQGSLDKIEAEDDEFNSTADAVWQRLHTAPGTLVIPSSSVYSGIHFDQEKEPGELSLPALCGIDLVWVRADSDNGRTFFEVYFHFQDESKLQLVSIRIDDDGSIAVPFLSLAQEKPGLVALFRLIAITSIHDLILREEVTKRERQTPTSAARKQSEKQTQKPAAETPRPEADYLIPAVEDRGWLPFKRMGQFRILEEENLVDQVEKRVTGRRRPRRVGIFPRRVPGGLQYQRAVDNYYQALSQEDEVMINTASTRLDLARDRLTKVSPEKLASFPSILRDRLVIITDPVTGRQHRITTWVVAHYNPKLKGVEKASMAKLFKIRYKGAALPCLDRVKGMIFA